MYLREDDQVGKEVEEQGKQNIRQNHHWVSRIMRVSGSAQIEYAWTYRTHEGNPYGTTLPLRHGVHRPLQSLSDIHLQKQLTSEETVQGKVAFETFCKVQGVKVKHYHADNGRFADKGFVNQVNKYKQSITYCMVNAPFQNRMAEKRIRALQDQTTTMLMHAESKWPDVISANLWPDALLEANKALNATPSKVTGKVANQMFARTDAPTVLRHFHPFRWCPTYIPNNNLAAGKSIPKWHKRTVLCAPLGRSPNH